ncbi:MAG: glycosyltransferase family 4 protein, partial [Deltaproteobacteria bacterium]|nr:glycosyltransferase family 4 protein [Deltaproteobacteria bacterium]
MLTSSYPLKPDDYRGGFVRDLGMTLMDAGMDVEVAVPRPRGADAAPFDDPEGPRILWLPSILPGRARGFHEAGIETNLQKDPLAALTIPPFLLAYAAEAFVRAMFCDCILAHWLLPMGAVGAVLARVTGKPLVVVAHSGPPPAARLPPMVQTVRYTAGRASWVVCVSDSVRRQVLDMVGGGHNEHVLTLPLGIDLRPSAQPPRHGRGDLKLLFTGRLVRMKGLDVLMKSIRDMEGVRLTVMGEGPGGPVKNGGEQAQLVFHGAAAPEDVRAAMQT